MAVVVREDGHTEPAADEMGDGNKIVCTAASFASTPALPVPPPDGAARMGFLDSQVQFGAVAADRAQITASTRYPRQPVSRNVKITRAPA